MRSRFFAPLLVGAAVITAVSPGTASAQQLESPAALMTPGAPGVPGAPGTRPSLPVVRLGYSFPAGANAPPVSGFVPLAFAPATASYLGYRTAQYTRNSSFAPIRYGSIYTTGALTASNPLMPPAGMVTAVNTRYGTALIPLQSASPFAPSAASSQGYATAPYSQNPNYPNTPMAANSYSQMPVYPWSAYSGPLRRSYQGY